MSSYLTASCPGTGGSLKETPEDFLVEELPLYTPCGEGEHLYLTVEKRGLTTFDLLQQLARALKVPEREIGYAGLKDARATTRQTVSVTGVRPEQAMALELAGVSILAARYHRNKLRLGHLAGNRFEIRLRGVGEGALETALDVLHVLEQVGVPNLFGQQRYGSLGNSHLIGAALLRRNFAEAAAQIVGDPAKIDNERWRQGAEAFAAGDLAGALALLPPRMRDERRMIEALRAGRSAEEAVLALPRKLLRLYLSAFQSALFDRLVAMRLGTLETLWAGDLAFKHDNGACFIVEDPAIEQPRANRFEISPSAPLYGYKVTLAQGQAGLLERALLDKERLQLESFRLPGGLGMEGERRPLRVPLAGAAARQEGDDLLVSFSLPKGCYATSVLREIMKNEI
ncbi:MAG TPA: tRNA pseudouridine(13) synthase TruD [Desulfuromonadales bacterium]|nr:tRNA pseudouridine(13) synthase TruD [Desulfuromonadales bacterium]